MEQNKQSRYDTVCVCACVETKVRLMEEQVGKKWDTGAGRSLRVLKPDGGVGM